MCFVLKDHRSTNRSSRKSLDKCEQKHKLLKWLSNCPWIRNVFDKNLSLFSTSLITLLTDNFHHNSKASTNPTSEIINNTIITEIAFIAFSSIFRVVLRSWTRLRVILVVIIYALLLWLYNKQKDSAETRMNSVQWKCISVVQSAFLAANQNIKNALTNC